MDVRIHRMETRARLPLAFVSWPVASVVRPPAYGYTTKPPACAPLVRQLSAGTVGQLQQHQSRTRHPPTMPANKELMTQDLGQVPVSSPHGGYGFGHGLPEAAVSSTHLASR